MAQPQITQRVRSRFSPQSTPLVAITGTVVGITGMTGRDALDRAVAIHRNHWSQSAGAGTIPSEAAKRSAVA